MFESVACATDYVLYVYVHVSIVQELLWTKCVPKVARKRDPIHHYANGALIASNMTSTAISEGVHKRTIKMIHCNTTMDK